MEAREEVEEASDPSHLRTLLEGCRAKEGALVEALAVRLEAGDLPAAKDLATQLIYTDRLRQAIVDKLPSA